MMGKRKGMLKSTNIKVEKHKGRQTLRSEIKFFHRKLVARWQLSILRKSKFELKSQFDVISSLLSVQGEGGNGCLRCCCDDDWCKLCKMDLHKTNFRFP